MNKAFLLAVLCTLVLNSGAGITYDTDSNTIRVTDFSSESPCTLEKLAKTDALMGWGKVVRNDKQYTLNANLIVGGQDGTETYFSVRPGEELICQGDLAVAPFWVSDNNSNPPIAVRMRNTVNRLTLEKCTVKIANNRSFTSGVIRNGTRWERHTWGGQIHAQDSKITAETGKFRTNFWAGNSHDLVHCEISEVRGDICYGMVQSPFTSKSFFRAKNCVFKNYDSLAATGAVFEDCLFTGATTAFRDSGSFSATLKRCTIKDNVRNFAILYYQNKQATVGFNLMDCTLEPGKQPDIMAAKNAPSPYVPAITESFTVSFTGRPDTVYSWTGGPEPLEFRTDKNGHAEVVLPAVRRTLDGKKENYIYNKTVTPSLGLKVQL